MSLSRMLFAMNPAKMVGQFERVWPLTARSRASCSICCRDARMVYLRETRVKEARNRSEREPALGARAGLSGCHLAVFDGHEDSAKVVAMDLQQLDVALQGLTV